LIAYRKSTISLADQVVFLDHGKITAEGTHTELRETSADYRALVDAYDEAAISHNLLEASGPHPSDGLDPAVSIPAQRARTVADAVERHSSGQYRREETDTGAIDLTGAFADPSPGPAQPQAESRAPDPGAAAPGAPELGAEASRAAGPAQPSAESRAPDPGVAEPGAPELGGEASGAEGPATAESGTAGPGTEAPDAEGPDVGRDREDESDVGRDREDETDQRKEDGR